VKSSSLLLILLLSFSLDAYGQTACPTGVTAGSAQCGPAPQSPGGAGRAATPRPEVWVDNWFSYAQCSQTGKNGFAHTFDTAREARQAAISLCQAEGGVKCETIAVNKNSCFSLAGAMGDDPGRTHGGIYSEGATLGLAEDMSIGRCMREYPGLECRVTYSMCNLRERVL
jgi:hypothetical protein